MTVHEPATLLTDLLLAVLSGWLAWRLYRHLSDGQEAALWWSHALGLTSLSALVGGTYHGFAPNFPATVANLWWISTLLIINLLSAAMALSLVHEIKPAGRQGPWIGLIAFKFVAFAGVATVHHRFVVAIIDYGLVMLMWAAAAVMLRRSWSGWMLAGIGLSVAAALVQQLRLAPSPSFNHNDLYHVVQALALLCFYGAGRKFTSSASISPVAA